jgi:hypothetical protein
LQTIDPSSNTIELTDAYPTDNTTWASVLARLPTVLNSGSQVMGRTIHDLYGEAGSDNHTFGCYWSDCTAGEFITDALYNYCGDCDLAIFNSGAIRASVYVANAGGNSQY